MSTETKGIKPFTRTTVYLEPNIHREFAIIIKREGFKGGISGKLREFEARYVAVHKKGNPQLLLLPYLGDFGKSKCFRCDGLFDKLTHVRFISRLRAYLCDECKEYYNRQNTIQKVLGVVYHPGLLKDGVKEATR